MAASLKNAYWSTSGRAQERQRLQLQRDAQMATDAVIGRLAMARTEQLSLRIPMRSFSLQPDVGCLPYAAPTKRQQRRTPLATDLTRALPALLLSVGI